MYMMSFNMTNVVEYISIDAMKLQQPARSEYTIHERN